MCFYDFGREFFKSNLILNKILICYSRSITQCISENVKHFINLLLFRFYFVGCFIYLSNYILLVYRLFIDRH